MLIRQGIHRVAHLLTGLHLGDIGLIHAGPDLHLAQITGHEEQGGGVHAAHHRLAHVHLAHHDSAVHRRGDAGVVAVAHLALQLGLGALQLSSGTGLLGRGRLQLSSGAFQISGCNLCSVHILVILHLREGIAHAQVLRTGEVAVGLVLVGRGLGNRGFGLSHGGLGGKNLSLGLSHRSLSALDVQLHDGIIDAGQQLTGLHLAAVVHLAAVHIQAEFLDFTRHLGTYVHQLLGFQRTSGLHLAYKILLHHRNSAELRLRSGRISGEIPVPCPTGADKGCTTPLKNRFHGCYITIFSYLMSSCLQKNSFPTLKERF